MILKTVVFVFMVRLYLVSGQYYETGETTANTEEGSATETIFQTDTTDPTTETQDTTTENPGVGGGATGGGGQVTQAPTNTGSGSSSSEIIPSELLILLPVILQLISSLINNNQVNNTPPPQVVIITPPPAPATPAPETRPPPHHHYYHHHPPYYGLPLDYGGLFNPFYNYVADPFLFPFRSQGGPDVQSSKDQRRSENNIGRKVHKKTSESKQPRSLPMHRARYKKKGIIGSKKIRKRPSLGRRRKKRISGKGTAREVSIYKSRFKKARPSGLPKLYPGPLRRPRIGKRPKIAFKKRFKIPGRRNSVVVSSSDVYRGLNFLYKGRNYRISLEQLLKILRRKQLKMKTRG